jgi:multidrug efflux pump subunit AcrA (membrane-fusion protein)
VFVVDGDHVTAHELKTGERLGERIEIVSGVKAGDAVAVGDVESPTDGMKIATKN